MRIQTVACVGAGIIGCSWAVTFSRSVPRVRLFEPDAERRGQLPATLRAMLENLHTLNPASGGPGSIAEQLARIEIHATLEAAVADAGYVQESVPEDLALKREVFAQLDTLTPANAILASSTSEFVPSGFLQELPGRARCLVVHPLNPPHLIPAVEVCPAAFTDPVVVDQTVALMRRVGQRPALLRREVRGFIMNRLQLAILREALSLIEQGVCTVADLDITVKYGLGLRWATMGPFETNHLSTAKGYSDFLTRYGETMESIMGDLCPDYRGNASLGAEIDRQLAELLAGMTHEEVEARRDRNLARLLAAGQEELEQ